MKTTTAQRFGSLGKSFVSPSAAAAVLGAALIASGTTDEAETEWSPAAACLLPDVLPVAGTLLSYGGDRQLAAGGTVTHSGAFNIGANALTCGAITASDAVRCGALEGFFGASGASGMYLFTSGAGGMRIGSAVYHPSGTYRGTTGSSDFLFGLSNASNSYTGPDILWGRDSAGVFGLYTDPTRVTKAALTCGAITASGVVTASSNSAHTFGATGTQASFTAGVLSLSGSGLVRTLTCLAAGFASSRGFQADNGNMVFIQPTTGLYFNTGQTTLQEQSAGVIQIGTAAGSNALGSLLLTNLTASGAIQETPTQSALDPTTTNIPSGKRQGWYNSTLAEFRDWVNIGGTLLKSAAYT